MAAIGKSRDLSEKSHLPAKIETDGLQGGESFETLIETRQALICDVVAAVCISQCEKNHLLLKVNVDGL